MIFFDLEFYVPKEDRNKPETRGSLVFNPAKSDNKILGGYFILKDIFSDKIRRKVSLWIWNFKDEKELLEQIYKLFIEEISNKGTLNIKIMGRNIVDILTVGFGISRIDLNALFIRSNCFKIKSKERLFEVYLKTKTIDLSNVGSFLFPEDITHYPKSTNEILQKLFADVDKKESGKSVWKYYDNNQFTKIEERCEKEVESIYDAYQKFQEILSKIK